MRITLCGSTRFMKEFHEANLRLTLQGHSVYSVATSVKEDFQPTEEQKTLLDLVHLDKISNSDAIYVLNVDGYIGFSTAREIQWAKMQQKDVFFLSAGTLLKGKHNVS